MIKIVKICIDAGHYNNQNRSPVVPDYYEAIQMWKLHNYVKDELLKYDDVLVITTRQEQKKDLGLTARGQFSKGCDLFLSYHSNACNSPYIDRAVVIGTINGKATDLGKKLMKTITEAMKLQDPPQYTSRAQSDGRDWYGVLRGAASVGVGGLILEHGFHTNQNCAKWLLKDENLKKLAKAEAKTIADHYGCELKVSEGSENVDNSVDNVDKCEKLYKVQVGAFKSLYNALNHMELLKERGFDAIVKNVNGFYKVQVGAYSIKENANKLMKLLKEAGFESFVTLEGVQYSVLCKKTNEEIAREVLRDVWGCDPERSERLTAAGYNPKDIQKIVNKLMG